MSSLLRAWVFLQILSTMARRPRSSRAWHFVLSAAHRDADARAVALAGTTNWGYDSDGQVGPGGGCGHGWTKGQRCPGQAVPEPELKEKDAPGGRGWARERPSFPLVKDPCGPGVTGPQDRYHLL